MVCLQGRVSSWTVGPLGCDLGLSQRVCGSPQSEAQRFRGGGGLRFSRPSLSDHHLCGGGNGLDGVARLAGAPSRGPSGCGRGGWPGAFRRPLAGECFSLPAPCSLKQRREVSSSEDSRVRTRASDTGPGPVLTQGSSAGGALGPRPRAQARGSDVNTWPGLGATCWATLVSLLPCPWPEGSVPHTGRLLARR